ncbi:hypothetical protein AWH48_11625 [Domibacillus aminovorans]|uniref:Uncharacterized protein n=1 Tax=Domibacillus aminovorans TaxID=29332 RepID=A0A177KMW6_9BACI|nr:hypothetical protein [Domibacillus aminovorans]OAH53911.1 hypothetical protein AWH48_11625 [Domibacillus aminovorans]
MEELLKLVLDKVGKTPEEFEREVEELKDETDAAKTLQRIEQQQAETSAMLLDFMEYMATGGTV